MSTETLRELKKDYQCSTDDVEVRSPGDKFFFFFSTTHTTKIIYRSLRKCMENRNSPQIQEKGAESHPNTGKLGYLIPSSLWHTKDSDLVFCCTSETDQENLVNERPVRGTLRRKTLGVRVWVYSIGVLPIFRTILARCFTFCKHLKSLYSVVDTYYRNIISSSSWDTGISRVSFCRNSKHK